MQQTAHRHSLGATPVRPSVGTSLRSLGITPNSRVQPTGYLLSHYARGVQGIHGLGITPNSRVQPTGYLLSHFGQGAPAASTVRSSPVIDAAAKAGMAGAATAAVSHGLGVIGASWLTQGVVLAATAEFIRKFFEDGKSSLEKEAELVDAAKKVNDPFRQAGIVGYDTYIVADSSLAGARRHNSGLGFVPPVIAAPAITSGVGANAGWLAAAGGPIGIGVAAVTMALQYLYSRQRPARKVATTQIVDEVEPLLQKNLADYMAGPRTYSSQAQALANFDAGWQFVKDNCDIPEMGQPGQWCVNDRKAGGKWDWFARYRTPIANDPSVVADPEPDIATSVDPVTGQRIYTESAGSVSNMMPLLVALGIVAVVFTMGD